MSGLNQLRYENMATKTCCKGIRIRTSINGFGDHCTTVVLYPCLLRILESNQVSQGYEPRELPLLLFALQI